MLRLTSPSDAHLERCPFPPSFFSSTISLKICFMVLVAKMAPRRRLEHGRHLGAGATAPVRVRNRNSMIRITSGGS